MNAFRKFLVYMPLILARPSAAVDSLAQEKGVWVGFVPMAVYAGLAVIHNIIPGLLYGWDYLGTSPLLTNPTFVGAFGYWKVNLDEWSRTPFWYVLNPLIWVVMAGFAQLITRLWDGKGTFEQGLNSLGDGTFINIDRVSPGKSMG